MMAVKRPLTLTFILILFIVYLIGPATAAPGGYIVKPAPETDPDEEVHEFTPISFWELSPRAMLIDIAICISPALIFPVELLFAVKLWIYLGYRKVAKYNVLDNNIRSEMFEHICNNPGITFSALARECNIGKGTQQYHLKVLKREHKIVSVKKKGQTGFFENNEKYEELQQTILMQLRSDTVRHIYEILIRHPNISRKELSRCLGRSGSAVTWQMDRLCAEGTVSATKSGKYTRYLLNPKAKEILRDYLPDYPAADATGQAQKESSELRSAVLVTSGEIPSSD
ncbi:winged helix-turn-helix transcriptional regulator [Methanogenium organophilum]|uniref:Winged helix-turn-helix transcriptional regulator n=1 Tax=Methanogenium organophilum TaxID=2199 RepID=A0A9X9S464_METOG|nr:winged helix-turn-helix transcriptional regulator [Methanogenium organophilum]WAI01458.1 winged helix-turn-helix transcriptional regulator [Methanogenium organophilum]